MPLIGHSSFSLVVYLRVYSGSSAAIKNPSRDFIGVFLASINTCGVMDPSHAISKYVRSSRVNCRV